MPPTDDLQSDHDEVPYPSLDVIRAELDMRLAEQERRGAAFDARAGLILAFGGVLIGLSARDPSGLQLLGRGPAQSLPAPQAGPCGHGCPVPWGRGRCATGT